jgi:cell division protein FtsL
MTYRTGSRSLVHPSGGARSRSRARVVSVGTLVFFLVAGTVSGLCFLHLWQTTRIHDLTASTRSATERLADVEGVNRALELQIEEAFSLERIARIARDRLGMTEPTVVHYVPLPADGSD